MDPEPIALTSLVGSVDIENPTYGIGLANHQNTAAGFFMTVRDTLRDMKKNDALPDISGRHSVGISTAGGTNLSA
jgi:hypothetical protein